MGSPTWLEGYFTPYIAPQGTGFFHATNGQTDPAAKLIGDGDIAPGASFMANRLISMQSVRHSGPFAATTTNSSNYVDVPDMFLNFPQVAKGDVLFVQSNMMSFASTDAGLVNTAVAIAQNGFTSVLGDTIRTSTGQNPNQALSAGMVLTLNEAGPMVVKMQFEAVQSGITASVAIGSTITAFLIRP